MPDSSNASTTDETLPIVGYATLDMIRRVIRLEEARPFVQLQITKLEIGQLSLQECTEAIQRRQETIERRQRVHTVKMATRGRWIKHSLTIGAPVALAAMTGSWHDVLVALKVALSH